ncbi:MAG: ISNCY family transposase [Pseudomonadales bacterium]|nr:ISNCY family transposase [Pseudomonadales bacterium]MCP5188320.1 ISNCY family transposase [Pseudomonadales bacterium]
MRFEEAYDGWQDRRLTQEQAAQLLGVCERTFRRYIDRYEEAGMEGLMDKRISEVSSRRAPVDEVLRLEALYKERYDGWSVKHFFERYQDEHKGQRSYTWVKSRLQASALAPRGKRRGTQRRRRPRAPLPGMMIHQDGSTHEWVPGQVWDLIVTMDDANSEIYSAFFVEEEGTLSSFQGVRETLLQKGLFSSFYSDRGSHYWVTTEAGDKVDKRRLTQFGRAMNQLGIQMIAAYSPEARGRSERFFRTLQDRLPKELALANVTTMEAANAFLRRTYLKRFNRRFMVTPTEPGSAFVPLLGVDIDNILCRQVERQVSKDSCVSYQGMTLELPQGPQFRHFARKTVKVHEYPKGNLALFHGPRHLASYTADGRLKGQTKKAAA